MTELKQITTRLPAVVYTSAIRWVGNYNATHCKELGFHTLNLSDVIRLAVQSFVVSISPHKFFLGDDVAQEKVPEQKGEGGENVEGHT